ncbi:MAG UNVERIFIED_CONTAM: hypothetical protein LVR18_30420 [Planctomycetaceae bacterium]|jgi:hypothetical protein
MPKFGGYRKVLANVKADKKVEALEAKLIQLNWGIAEMLQEHVQLKKAKRGPLSRRWSPHDTRDQNVNYVNRWTVHVVRSHARAKGFVQLLLLPFAQSQPTPAPEAVDGPKR